MLWSSTGILLSDVARDRIEIVVVLFSAKSSNFVHNCNKIIPISVKELQSGALKFCSIVTEFQDLCLVHILQLLLRCFTEPVDLLRLAHIFQKLFFVLM